MSYKVEDIEGIGPAYGEKLRDAGIVTTAALLKRCGKPKGRKELAMITGIDDSRILKWTNLADLMRIKGIGTQFSELLEAAGVDTVKELKHRNAVNLTAKMQEINAEKKLTRTTPAKSVVTTWIEQAKSMPPTIGY